MSSSAAAGAGAGAGSRSSAAAAADKDESGVIFESVGDGEGGEVTVCPTFEAMGLKEGLLRGIFAHGFEVRRRAVCGHMCRAPCLRRWPARQPAAASAGLLPP